MDIKQRSSNDQVTIKEIKMTDSENSFTHEGVEYVAVDGAGGRNDCLRCDLVMLGVCHTAPSCTKNQRKDGREVIFKKVEL